uniref:Uncharacterized protein n=1 Tax=Rhizophora mucronata TaxID=61149 RepID=A0A2P2QZW4_RHIMU
MRLTYSTVEKEKRIKKTQISFLGINQFSSIVWLCFSLRVCSDI